MHNQERTILGTVLLFLLAAPLIAQPGPSGFTVLLSNDDGYEAPGLRALIEALRPVGEIVVAAPATDKSAIGHSLILRTTATTRPS